ncbi:hypothetical protein VTK26DRAFT_6005 [Humicola hyalothermophila]
MMDGKDLGGSGSGASRYVLRRSVLRAGKFMAFDIDHRHSEPRWCLYHNPCGIPPRTMAQVGGQGRSIFVLATSNGRRCLSATMRPASQ